MVARPSAVTRLRWLGRIVRPCSRIAGLCPAVPLPQHQSTNLGQGFPDNELEGPEGMKQAVAR